LPSNANSFKGMQTAEDKRIDIEYAGFYVVSNVYGFPDEDASRLRKAYCLLFLGKFDEALKSVKEVKDSDKSALCLFLRGLAKEHKGEHKEALHAYDSALRLDNDIIDAHKKRGVYMMEIKEWDLAAHDFSHMLRINPEAYVAHRFRALSRYYASKFAAALYDYNKFLAKDSSNFDVLAERAMTYRQMNLVLPSTVDFLKSRKYNAVDNFDVISKELDKLLEKNDTAKVHWWLDQFIKYDRVYFEAHKFKLHLLMKQNRWDDVGRHADFALLRRDDSTKIFRADINEASVTYVPVAHSFLLTVKGISLLHQDDHVQAIRELNAAIDLDKNNTTAYVSRARAQLKLSNKEGAVRDLKKAASLGDKEAEAMLKEI